MTEQNKSPPKEGRLIDDDGKRLPLLRLLFDHQRWLNSNGHFGKRFDDDDFGPLRFQLCDLDGIDLSFANLEHVTFNGGSVKGARFIGANLKHAWFDRCDVAAADFTNADLTWANFRTNHEEACFKNARCAYISVGEELSIEKSAEILRALDEHRRASKTADTPEKRDALPSDNRYRPGTAHQPFRLALVRWGSPHKGPS